MEIWSENAKANCLVKWMEMSSGGPKKDVALFNGRVRACGKCEMGAAWGHWTVGFLEVPKPRLLAHFYQEARTEG